MVSVPQYDYRQGVDRTPTEYSRVTPNADAFGAAVFQAKQNLAHSVAKINFDVQKIKDDIDTTRAMEYRNFVEKTKMKYLNDPEVGYFTKLGKNAMADPNDPDSGANGVVNAITRELEAKQQELGLTSGKGKQLADYFTASQLNGIILETGKHERDQRLKWQEAVTQEAVELSSQEMVNNRNNPEQVDKEISNIKAAISYLGSQAGLDDDMIKASQTKAVSNSIYLTIKTMASDGNIGAEAMLEKYKNMLSPEHISQLEPAIHNTKINYEARTVAQNLLLVPESEAYKTIEGIKDIEVQERARSYYQTLLRQNDRLEQARLNELEQASWDKVRQSLDYNDIDYTSRPETISAQMSFIKQMKELGRIQTNYGTWQYLTEMATHNAEYFKQINLNDYAAELTESELKHFKDLQEKVGSMEFTQIQDDNKIIEEAMDSVEIGGRKKTKNVIYSEMRALVRESELRKGRKLNDDEIKELAEGLGYKGDDGVKVFKLIEAGMAEQVGFTKKVVNDFEYFEKVHKRKPSAEEKYKIINQRVMEYRLDQNRQLTNQLENSQNQKSNGKFKIGDKWNGHKINSLFGTRKRPAQNASKDHQGVDLDYKLNEPIKSFSGGTVVLKKTQVDKKGNITGYGHYIDIRDDNGVIHRYAHANSIDVQVGDKINPGQVIGKAGKTGNATGVCLHYEQIINGKSVNPIEEKITIKAPNGKIVLVPKNKVNEAIKNGGQII